MADAKVRDYLLSPTHPIGRFKAIFFTSLGFSVDRWQDLQAALLDHARIGVAGQGQVGEHGTKYEVRAQLPGPAGRAAEVVSIWILVTDDAAPALITAYPG